MFWQVKVCFGSKFPSATEGRRFNWLIYDSMASQCACGRFLKIKGFVCKRFLPSPPPPPLLIAPFSCSRTAQKRLLRRLLFSLQTHLGTYENLYSFDRLLNYLFRAIFAFAINGIISPISEWTGNHGMQKMSSANMTAKRCMTFALKATTQK